jgi:hypothetical protein
VESLLEATGASLSSHQKELLDFIIESLEIPEDEAFGIDPGPSEELRDYHFDFGNSSYGPVGGSAVVAHYSAAQALALLRERMSEEVDILTSHVARDEKPHVIYGHVYLNEEAITLRDIDEVTAHAGD